MTREQAIDAAVRRVIKRPMRDWISRLTDPYLYVAVRSAPWPVLIRHEFARIMVEASRTERSARGAPTLGSRNLRTTTLSAEQASALASWAESSGRNRGPDRQ